MSIENEILVVDTTKVKGIETHALLGACMKLAQILDEEYILPRANMGEKAEYQEFLDTLFSEATAVKEELLRRGVGLETIEAHFGRYWAFAGWVTLLLERFKKAPQ